MCLCSDDRSPMDAEDILNRLKGLSAVKEFFELLDGPYDPKVLDLSRLHIMKRMGQYLGRRTSPTSPCQRSPWRCSGPSLTMAIHQASGCARYCLKRHLA